MSHTLVFNLKRQQQLHYDIDVEYRSESHKYSVDHGPKVFSYGTVPVTLTNRWHHKDDTPNHYWIDLYKASTVNDIATS